MSSLPNNQTLHPLGVFGLWAEFPLRKNVLLPLLGTLDDSTRKNVSHYLESGTPVFAFMEYSRDVIGDKFGTSGGPAMWTDGYYFYRYEAADYVATYGIEVPEAALERMKSFDWAPPAVDPNHLEDMRRWLVKNQYVY